MKHIVTLFSMLIFFNLSNAQILSIQNRDSLDLFFHSLQENEKFMGQVEISQNGQIEYHNSIGFSNIEANLKAKKNSKYRIGSISKTFTATLILKAVEEGKINLTHTIETFFPTIKNAQIITIEQLLTHHSGIHNFTSGNEFMKWHTFPKTASEVIAIISAGGSDFGPGDKAEYSNSNYVLLSFILESIYHKNYADILREKIVKPLGLKHTQFGDKSIPEYKKTYSYTFEVKWKKEGMTDESIPMGAGGIITSANDLSIFINGLFDGKIISKETLNKMLEQKDDYGMGIFKKEIVGKEVYTHDGKIDGFNAFYYYFPEQKLTYILFSNGENFNLEKINDLALRAVFNQKFNVPKINPVKLTDHDLVKYLGVYKSEESPLIITISQNGNRLLAQPNGQQIFTMDAIKKNVFKHEKSGVTLEFKPDSKLMTMRQGNQILHFFKM